MQYGVYIKVGAPDPEHSGVDRNAAPDGVARSGNTNFTKEDIKKIKKNRTYSISKEIPIFSGNTHWTYRTHDIGGDGAFKKQIYLDKNKT